MRRSEAKNDWQLTVYIPRELRGEILSPSSGGWRSTCSRKLTYAARISAHQLGRGLAHHGTRHMCDIEWVTVEYICAISAPARR